MKYANLGGLTDNFINETYMQEEELEEGRHDKEVEEGRHDSNEGMREEDEDGILMLKDDPTPENVIESET